MSSISRANTFVKDNTIIATAIPRITDEFHALEDVGWYASAYLLTTCAFQLLFGKFYTFFSIKWVYLIAIAIFELGSLICGVAPNSIALIVGRAIAGLGSAGIFSGALIIIAYSVPLAKRPIYTGLIGGVYGIASVAGPLMGVPSVSDDRSDRTRSPLTDSSGLSDVAVRRIECLTLFPYVGLTEIAGAFTSIYRSERSLWRLSSSSSNRLSARRKLPSGLPLD